MPRRIRRSDVTVSRTIPAGAWVLSCIRNGYREHRTYYFYTKGEAMRAFLDEMNQP